VKASHGVTDAFGDPAHLDGALGRLETGQPLRAVDLQELSYAIGREAALKLARTAEEDRARNARRPPKASGFWGWMFGPIQDSAEISPAVLDVIDRIRSGQLLRPSDATRIPRKIGRGVGRGIEKAVDRSRGKAGTRAAQHRQTNHPTRARGPQRRTTG
jgi:hypothetical protein